MNSDISLGLKADVRFVPLIQSMAEHCGRIYGLSHDKTLRLTMAVEELLVYLATKAPDLALSVLVENGGTCIRVVFVFAASDIDLGAMNLTTCIQTMAENDMTAMGLLLAARMTDSFRIIPDGRSMRLSLRMDRDYPVSPVRPTEPFARQGQVYIPIEVDAELLKEGCILAASLYPADRMPAMLRRPGMVVDSWRNGGHSVLLILDQAQRLCGMLIWTQTSASGASFSGPYVFCDDPLPVARQLSNGLVSRLARSSVQGLFSVHATEHLPQEDFELLGYRPAGNAHQSAQLIPVWFRHLGEDRGLTVWSHELLESFLGQQYDRLVLARDLRTASRLGERQRDRSVLTATLRPETGEALLLPMLDGADFEDNLRRHVLLLHEEGCPHIVMHIDLAQGWQVHRTDALLACGFEPTLLLPYAGQADLIEFRHVHAHP